MKPPMMPSLALGMVLALPAVAQQNCPTAAELTRGIRIDFIDGSTETFRSQGGGTMVVDGREADGADYRLELAQGLHLLGYEVMVDGRPDPTATVTYDYGMAPDALPVPVPLARHTLGVTPRDSQGTWSETQTHAYGAMESVLIGGCTYDMFSAVILYDTESFYTEGLNYLPELGLGYLLWTETTDEVRVPNAAIGIRAVTK